MVKGCTRADYIATVDQIVRQISWHNHKLLIQTLSRPDIALTMPQMVTLYAIRSAHCCRMSDLAEVTQQSAGTLTGIIDRLIEDDLVGRVRDTDDRRVVQVTLTAQGEERLNLLEQARRDDVERMLNNFSIEQLEQLEGLLDLLAEGLSDVVHHPVAPEQAHEVSLTKHQQH